MFAFLFKYSIIGLFCTSFLLSSARSQTVQVWWSSELYPEDEIWFTNPPPASRITYGLSEQKTLHFQTIHTNSDQSPLIHIEPDSVYQTIIGIGTSLEATTVYAILKNKNETEIAHLLKQLIDPQTGIGLNLFRITIGTSDFSDGRQFSNHPQGFYSYQDHPDSVFSIQNDIELGIIKVLKMARKVARELAPPQEILFFASCWSPPGWMKTSGELIGGSLKPGYEWNLARYFRKFIEAYGQHGIPVYAITIQNEPNFTPDTYPGMLLTWQQERDIVIAAWETFHQENLPPIDTRIWINDHNFEYWVNADSILTSLAHMNKKHYVDAVAFHNYSDAPPENMTRLHRRHPDIKMAFSERSEFGVHGIYLLQQYFQNWATTYAAWVTMSSQDLSEHNQGPYNHLGMLSPTMLIQKQGKTAEWYATPEFYLLGQFSRFIRPGARRIFTTPASIDKVTAVAFLNPDQSIALILVNQTDEMQNFRVQFRTQFFDAALAGKTAGTYVWPFNKNK